MKRLLSIALLALTTAAFGATLNPIQLLNPTGSSAGQAIVSTGASSAPAWGGIGVNGIAAIAANTVLANATGSSASPTAFAMPSCTGAANALGYTSGTGIVCNSAINAAQLAGQTFTSPTITTPTITGVTSGSCAATGNVGECKNSNVPLGSAVSLTTVTAANITSVSLTAGNWICYGNVGFTPGGTTVTTAEQAWISSTSATPTTSPNAGAYIAYQFLNATGNPGANVMPAGMIMENVTTTTTVFLEALAAFSTNTQAAYGYINCIRWH